MINLLVDIYIDYMPLIGLVSETEDKDLKKKTVLTMCSVDNAKE